MRVQVSVNARATGSPLVPIWPFFGYDEINYTTLPEGRALLANLAGSAGATPHVRNHFWFNTGDGAPAMKWGSTNVYTQDAMGAPVYDFSATDEVLEAMTGSGALPFVELGFMPEALSTHPKPYRNSNTIALNGGCFYPPNDYTAWGQLVEKFALHGQERHSETVPGWLWELWNEPDSGYWRGTFEEYAKLYDYTEAALHRALPRAVLGGPAVIEPGGSFLRKFLEHCTSGQNAVTGETGTRLDLVTFHAKGGVSVVGDHVELNLGHQLRLHQDGFQAVAAFPQLQGTPIYISEADPDGCAACPADAIEGAAYRTSTAYGAYELSMMKLSEELAAQLGVKLAGVLTWAFTFPEAPYFAGFRELSSHGLELPVFAAFKLLGRLQGDRLPLSSSAALAVEDVVAGGVKSAPLVDGMASREQGTVRVLLWSYQDAIVAGAPTPVRLSVQLPAELGGRVHVTELRVDEAHGNVFNAWRSLGSPPAPDAEQLSTLRQRMSAAPVLPDQTLPVAADGSVTIELNLTNFSVSLLTIERN